MRADDPSDPIDAVLRRLETRWRAVESDADLEEKQQVAMALIDELVDLEIEHPDRLEILKVHVQLLAYPLAHWSDVEQEMEPLRAVEACSEMLERFERRLSVRPFS